MLLYTHKKYHFYDRSNGIVVLYGSNTMGWTYIGFYDNLDEAMNEVLDT